ncbi:hypothetical protein [Roseibium marinum]|uniref:Uncharacterized protein n=1 Tax=Roseibium marinum TaxID=281252 RepID=A0A2S3UJR8_9HYPH|nr:hypothetical protein [Roseibium marinum]POF27972.1 hypothetical protein CLV41_11953 [Roseibium marinum]
MCMTTKITPRSVVSRVPAATEREGDMFAPTGTGDVVEVDDDAGTVTGIKISG